MNLSINISELSKLSDSKNLLKYKTVNDRTERIAEANDEGIIFDEKSKNYANENQYSYVYDFKEQTEDNWQWWDLQQSATKTI